MNRVIVLGILAFLCGCDQEGEAIVVADYHITNKTGKNIILVIKDKDTKDDIELIQSELAIGERAKVLELRRSPGLKVIPENAFYRIVVYAGTKVPANIIYSRVNNAEWIYEGPTQDQHLIYHLSLFD